jgi:transcriptional regulator with XRE-family HTH domain
MNGVHQSNLKKKAQPAYVDLLNEWHDRSGLSLREVAQACDLDYSYIHYILKGARKPSRDVIIALGFAYGLERVDVDEILLLAEFPPIGRGVLREYRQNHANSKEG